VEVMRNKNELKSDSNYPENFWPKILTLLFIGAFIFWVMTSQNAHKILDQYLFDPILRLFDRIK
jgi:hypothetical protein